MLQGKLLNDTNAAGTRVAYDSGSSKPSAIGVVHEMSSRGGEASGAAAAAVSDGTNQMRPG